MKKKKKKKDFVKMQTLPFLRWAELASQNLVINTTFFFPVPTPAFIRSELKLSAAESVLSSIKRRKTLNKISP